MYGLCRYKFHAQRFKFDIDYSDNGRVTLFVFSDAAQEVIRDRPRHYYQLAGKAREEIQKVSRAVKLREMHLEVGRETNKELAADDNMQNFKLLSKFQKAKSEHMILNERSSTNQKEEAQDFQTSEIGIVNQSSFQWQATRMIYETWENVSLSLFSNLRRTFTDFR